MKIAMKTFFKAWILVFLAAFVLSAEAEASVNQVRSIDPAGVEELIKSDHCPIIISIVTSRCRACRMELPVYQAMHDQYGDEGLGIFVVSIDFGYPDAIQRIVDQLGLTFPVFWGGDPVMHAYDISLVPYKIVVQHGEVVETVIGEWAQHEIEEKVAELMETCRR